MAKRAEFDRLPDHLPAKETKTPSGLTAVYELPFRKSKGMIGLVVISDADTKEPTVSIWEIAGK